MKIAIIGGGASGLMAGGELSQKGNEITIFDGNEKVGKKLYITGKGRCNLTNDCSVDEMKRNVVHGEKFLFSCLNLFPPQKTIEFFENLGLELKTERGNRVFPSSDKASDVIKALMKNASGCEFKYNEKVIAISKKQENFVVVTELSKYTFDRVIIATGGKSYPATGSDGDGYKFAKIFGHSVTTPKSALVPIKISDKFCSSLEGLSLKNVSLKANINGNKKELFGEMLFTNDALSGPIALSMSSYIGDEKNTSLSIDFKPALDEITLEGRLLREFEENKNKNISSIMRRLLPERLVDIFLSKTAINRDVKINSITKQMREKIIACLKNFELNFEELYPVEAGIVTSGGVDLKEINPKTMESKIVNGLYFIGEVLDIDCLTGGFNLQCAFATGYACAYNLK